MACKSKIYTTQPISLEDLRQLIVNECHQVTLQMLYRFMKVSGQQFEQLLL